MRIRVLLFARLRELAGSDALEVELPEGASLEVAWRKLQESHEPLRAYPRMPLGAVNREYAPAETVLHAGEEVAFFPPVSGGKGDLFLISDQPVQLEPLFLAASGEEVGALASFIGTVRNENAGKRVVAVEYHAYPEMAQAVMTRIGEEMRRGFGPLRIVMVHRVGRLGIGEVSVAIVIGSAHRHPALGAAAYAIERLKQAVPIWKKEFYEDGSSWLEPAPAVTPGRPET